MKKALSTFAILFLLITASVLMPFSLYADQSLPAPFVGFNVYYSDIEIDDEYETSIDGSSGTYSGNVARHTASANLSGNIVAIERTSSGITYVSTSISQGSVTGTDTMTGTITENSAAESGTITLNLSSSSTIHVSENGILEVEIILDNYYVGYFDITFKYVNSTRISKRIYVNGNSCKFTYATFGSVDLNADLSKYVIVIDSFNLNSSAYHQWFYPIESFSIIDSAWANGLEQIGINDYNDYQLPIFQVNQNEVVNGSRLNNGQSFYWIFMLDKTLNSTSAVQTYFDFGGLTVEEILLLNRYLLGNRYVSLVRVKLTNNTGSAANFSYKYIYSNSAVYVPIFNGVVSYKYVSTDFALQFGLTNDLLTNLNLIAQGNTASNNTVNQYNQSEQTMNNTISDYNTIENQFTDDFDQNMQNITPGDHGLNLMGSKFLNSANWVKIQFDRITTGTPFGSVLGFSLVLGLGLLIIGRVFG